MKPSQPKPGPMRTDHMKADGIAGITLRHATTRLQVLGINRCARPSCGAAYGRRRYPLVTAPARVCQAGEVSASTLWNCKNKNSLIA